MREVAEKQHIAKVSEVWFPLPATELYLKQASYFYIILSFWTLSDWKGLDFNAKQNDPSHGLWLRDIH